jgi:hypothetical protein
VFCSPTVAEMDHGRSATRRQLRRPSTMARAAFGGAPASGTASAVDAAWLPPPSGESAQEAPARWLDGGMLFGNGGSVWVDIGGQQVTIYRGLSSSRSGRGLLLLLSLIGLQITA